MTYSDEYFEEIRDTRHIVCSRLRSPREHLHAYEGKLCLGPESKNLPNRNVSMSPKLTLVTDVEKEEIGLKA